MIEKIISIKNFWKNKINSKIYSYIRKTDNNFWASFLAHSPRVKLDMEHLLDQVANTTTEIGTKTTHNTTCATITVIAVIGIAVVFHIFGIMLIIIKSSEMSNQSILLMHLSFISIILLAEKAYIVYRYTNPLSVCLYGPWTAVVFYAMHTAYLLSLSILSIDRLLFAIYDVHYRAVFSRIKLYFGILAVWLIATGYGLMVHYAPDLKISQAFLANVFFSCNSFTVAFTLLAYFVIILRVKTNAKANICPHQSRDHLGKYAIPFCMVLFFFIFNMVPLLVVKKIEINNAHAWILSMIVIGMDCLKHLLDAMIYIFLQQSICKKLKSLCCKCCYSKETYSSIITRNKMASISSSSNSSLYDIGIGNEYSDVTLS